MITYKQRRHSSPWVIGIVVFVLAMAITFADVYGIDRFISGRPGQTNEIPVIEDSPQTPTASMQLPTATVCGDDYSPTTPTTVQPPAVPEPTTILLLTTGCGILLATRRKLKS